MTKNDWNKNDFDAMSRDQLLVLWNNLKDTLETVKKNEMDLRRYIVAREFPNKKEGTNSIELGNNYELKATIKFNYKLNASNDKIEDILNKISKVGNRGSIVAERLISWKPNFLLSEWRLLQDEKEDSMEAKKILELINEILIITDATPTLEILEPKKQ